MNTCRLIVFLLDAYDWHLMGRWAVRCISIISGTVSCMCLTALHAYIWLISKNRYSQLNVSYRIGYIHLTRHWVQEQQVECILLNWIHTSDSSLRTGTASWMYLIELDTYIWLISEHRNSQLNVSYRIDTYIWLVAGYRNSQLNVSYRIGYIHLTRRWVQEQSIECTGIL
jgi:hypothetical protein